MRLIVVVLVAVALAIAGFLAACGGAGMSKGSPSLPHDPYSPGILYFTTTTTLPGH
jgi:hypothetical protein